MTDDIDNKVLFFLESGYDIDIILKELATDKENLANTIIELEVRGLIILENKKWTLTEKGKDILKEVREELLKMLKIEHMYGNINEEEFQKKRKELDSIVVVEKAEKEKINCLKCGKENKTGSKYCYKCGESLRS